ncbi:hypothetical protein ACFQE5_01685 [Pseudonocardia hispaniensis]|uniref:Uncharacterized protein n=1 Tax=Pseudonocardia hispaniensis TaxID=904933 RepID=A0ABW1IWS9_9PSEU
MIDKSSRRWTVAMHEAAHVVAARQLGWTVRYARIIRDGDEGVMDDAPPHGRDKREVAVESAVISLAGICASARQHWFLPYGCGHDQRDARKALRGTGMSLGDAKYEARRLVNKHWREIERVARQLYRDGEL